MAMMRVSIAVSFQPTNSVAVGLARDAGDRSARPSSAVAPLAVPGPRALALVLHQRLEAALVDRRGPRRCAASRVRSSGKPKVS